MEEEALIVKEKHPDLPQTTGNVSGLPYYPYLRFQLVKKNVDLFERREAENTAEGTPCSLKTTP